jgi:hypothetical protein
MSMPSTDRKPELKARRWRLSPSHSRARIRLTSRVRTCRSRACRRRGWLWQLQFAVWADTTLLYCDQTTGSMISLWVKHDDVISSAKQLICYMKCFQYSTYRSFTWHSQLGFFNKNFSDFSITTSITQKYCEWTLSIFIHCKSTQTAALCN